MAELETTVRDNVLENIKARFQNQRKGVDGARITWDVVSRDPLTENQRSQGYAVSLAETTERTKPIVGWDEKWLTVIAEVYVLVLDGDSAARNLGAAIGEVQRVMGLDNTCGGFAIDVVEQGSDIATGIPTDRIAAGAAGFTVRYRHRTGNPFLK